MAGYTLSIDSPFRRYVTAFGEGVARPSVESVFAAGTLMGASLDDGGGFGSLINDISTGTEVAMATPGDPPRQPAGREDPERTKREHTSEPALSPSDTGR